MAVLHTTDKNRPYAQVLEERDAATGDLQMAYTYGDDLISQHRPDPADPINNPPITRYYHYDGQMSTRQLSRGGGTFELNDQCIYDAFGMELAADGATDNAYRYTGEQYDATIGQYYLRARHFCPATARFLSRDPAAGHAVDPMSLHKYLYCRSDPVNRIDPSGEEWNLVTLLIVAAIIAILVWGIYSLVLEPLGRVANTVGGTGVDIVNDPKSPVQVGLVIGYIQKVFPQEATDSKRMIDEGLMKGHWVANAEIAGTIGSKTGVPLNASLNQGDYAMLIYGEWQRTNEGRLHYRGQPIPQMNRDLGILESYLIKIGARPTQRWRH